MMSPKGGLNLFQQVSSAVTRYARTFGNPFFFFYPKLGVKIFTCDCNLLSLALIWPSQTAYIRFSQPLTVHVL